MTAMRLQETSPPAPFSPSDWKREVRETVGPTAIKALTRRSAAKHFGVALALGSAWVGACACLWQGRYPVLWVPAALVAGWAVFDFTILLHEALHRTIFQGPHPRLYAALEWCYALPSGISHSQFTRWHLDHHANLGSPGLDPKRHRLSPKRNARWLKALYFTPALFFIYFRAARQETETYPEKLRRKISRERAVAIAFHLLVAGMIAVLGGWAVFLRVYAIPVFLVFPPVFALNRLGQHYAITPEDPAGWSTRMKASIFWDAAFLWSARHLEHHAFPAVPFYNLPALTRAIAPALDRHAIPQRGFLWLLWSYLIKNEAPHTEWH